MIRITRADVGVFDDAWNDGQEQACSLCSPLHGNHPHHHPSKVNRLCDYHRTLHYKNYLQVVLANPLSPLVHDSDSVYETEGSSVGRTILGTEATTTIAQVMVMMVMVMVMVMVLNPESQIIKSSTSSLLLSAFNIFILIAG